MEDIIAELKLHSREAYSGISVLQKAIQADEKYDEYIEIDDNLEMIIEKIKIIMSYINQMEEIFINKNTN